MDTTRFPLELERKIFELVAFLHPETIPNLLLVAHRVLTWIEPILYHVLRIDKSDMAGPIFDAIQHKPTQFLRDTVRHVLLYMDMWDPWENDRRHINHEDPWEIERIKKFLDYFPGIRNLSLLGNPLVPYACLLIPLGNMHLRRLCICVEDLFKYTIDGSPEVDLEHPLFETVTHLDILDYFLEDEEEDKEWLKQLPVLPALTHLAFNSPPPLSMIRHILSESPRLCVLLVELGAQSTSIFLDSIDVEDPRLVVKENKFDYCDDWEEGARGGKDRWSRTDAFVAAKKKGLIDSSCYLLDDAAELFDDDSDAEEVE
ncbi:hypothetical protein C8J57DRAFT_1498162 [Mycena rebaudengoi]|nr:hypothetical protein C8J57DRAFT_1498162 [Mycena rebaudengoi]